MAILNFQPGFTGRPSDGINPTICFLATNDTIDGVLAPGYLNTLVTQGYTLNEIDIYQVTTSEVTGLAPTHTGWLEAQHVNGSWSLVPSEASGDVSLPTITNHIAYFTNDSGGLASGTANPIIHSGGISAGLDAVAGTLKSYPSTTASGFLQLSATNNTGGNFNTIITNAANVAQSQTVSVPDVFGGTGGFICKTSAALVSGNLLVCTGNNGAVIDSGLNLSNVQNKTNIKAAQVTGLGGLGAGPIGVTAAGCTSSSIVVVSVLASSTLCAVGRVAPGSGNFQLSLTADPGATLTIQYIMFIASQ